MRLTWSVNTSNPENCHSPPSYLLAEKKTKPIVLQALGFFSCI